MSKVFNLSTGEQVELEDCVVNNIELDNGMVTIPEDVDNPTKFIDNDLDNQLDEPMLDSFMKSVASTTPEVLPSYKDYGAWRMTQEEYHEYEAKVMLLGEELDRLLKERYQLDVITPYRKELREWWFKRKNNDIR